MKGGSEVKGRRSEQAGSRSGTRGRRLKAAADSAGAPDWGAIARGVERWFRANARELPWRDGYEPWHVWISEVMAQQTRMDVVVARFAEFIRRFPTIEAMASASESDVVAAWSGLGYYRRARMLHRGARDVMERFGGELPADVEALRSIPGIGRYSAGSIASVAFGIRAAIVDGNVARVVSRLEAVDAAWKSGALERHAWSVAEALVAKARRPGDLNQGLMELGARVCTPRGPKCGECPLVAHCRAHALGRAGEFPRPAAKEKAIEVTIPLYVIDDGLGRILFRRGEGRLMHGMLHLPHGSDALYPFPLKVARPGRLAGVVKHSITRRRITFEVYRPPRAAARLVADAPGEWLWLEPGELARYPHPSYVAKALALLISEA